jgi:peptidoglycan-N-acetylglucosamine deacetylase
VGELEPNPNGYVCLSFDFDGPSLWMQRGMTTPTPISRGEFGAVAVPRILRLLGQRHIPSTFFVPGHTIETYPDICRMIVDAGCEVALHGYAHEFNPTPDRERWAMARSFELVDRLCGRPAAGYRAPSGELTVQTIDLLLEHGLAYDSSLMGHDYQPYRLRRGDRFADDGPAEWGEPTALVELPFSWTLDDYVYLEFVTFRRMLMPGLRRPADMFDNFTGDLEWMRHNVGHGVCTVVFHPQVIGRGHRLLALERWLDEVDGLRLGYASMGDVAAAYASGRSFGIEPRPPD